MAGNLVGRAYGHLWRDIVSAPSVLLLPSPFSAAMSQQDQFDRIVSALHEAALDDMAWPDASRLIDETVGMAGSHLVVMCGHTPEDAEFLFGDMYSHGEFNDGISSYRLN